MRINSLKQCSFTMRDGLKLRIPAVGNLFQCAQGRLVASNRFSGERSKYG